MAKRRAQKQKETLKEKVAKYLKMHPSAESAIVAKALKLKLQQVYSARNQLNAKKPKKEKFVSDCVKITIDLHGKVLTFDADTVVITNDSISAKFN